jgi:hypothetical protein
MVIYCFSDGLLFCDGCNLLLNDALFCLVISALVAFVIVKSFRVFFLQKAQE